MVRAMYFTLSILYIHIENTHICIYDINLTFSFHGLGPTLSFCTKIPSDREILCTFAVQIAHAPLPPKPGHPWFPRSLWTECHWLSCWWVQFQNPNRKLWCKQRVLKLWNSVETRDHKVNIRYAISKIGSHRPWAWISSVLQALIQVAKG